MKRKCLNFSLMFFINICSAFQKIKSNRKHGTILITSIITISFIFNHIRGRAETTNKNKTFADILHKLPIHERRYFVWKRALEIFNNQSNHIEYHVESKDNDTTINHLINTTITKYKVCMHRILISNYRCIGLLQ